MKQLYGFAWRDYVRGVTTTFDVGENLAFRERIETRLAELDTKWGSKVDPAFTLDPKKVADGKKLPNVVVVAADVSGNIVRYYETGETAPYFGSALARSSDTGLYNPAREGRMIASTGKIIAAIAIGNQGRDTPESLYLDTEAPAKGLDTCEKGGTGRNGRKAIVAFACSLNGPLLHRAAQLNQAGIRKLIDGFGLAMPPASSTGGTPPSTAVVLGQIAGAPRRVHHMSAVVLASLIGRGTANVRAPGLIKAYDYTFKGEGGAGIAAESPPAIIPNTLIRRNANALVKTLLQAPLCYEAGGSAHGTLKSLHHWCASRRGDLRLHFAKTGTQVGTDPNATIDAWLTGGLQFANGAAYSYVVLVGSGNPNAALGARAPLFAGCGPLARRIARMISPHTPRSTRAGICCHRVRRRRSRRPSPAPRTRLFPPLPPCARRRSRCGVTHPRANRRCEPWPGRNWLGLFRKKQEGRRTSCQFASTRSSPPSTKSPGIRHH